MTILSEWERLYLVMSEKQDIRWQQRFANYRKALSQLKDVVELENPNRFEEQGLVKAFDFTYELA